MTAPLAQTTLAELFREAMRADVDEELTCPWCGARGFTDCDTTKHITTFASFAAMNARSHRVYMRRRAP